MRSQFRPLRSPFVFPTLRKALAKATRVRSSFRIVHFSVQGDHLHLIVEASDRRSLSRGMQGLAIRIARQVNALVGRTGKLWADRFFARALPSPRAVRNALAYVLNNFRKHRARPDGRLGRLPNAATSVFGTAGIDPYSSAPFFDGFRELCGRAPYELAPSARLPLAPRGLPPPKTSREIPVVPASTWLAGNGWRRAGFISLTR